MNIFTRAAQALGLQKPAGQKDLGQPIAQAIQYRFFGGQIVEYTDKKGVYVDRGYTYNDIIYSIIRLIVEKAKVAPWGWYKVTDPAAYKAYQAELSRGEKADIFKLKKLHAKSMELYTADAKLDELLKWPNPNQTWADLNEELWSWKLITGDYYEYWEKPSGGLNAKTPFTLSALPSQYMLIEGNNMLPLSAERYYLFLGQRIQFEADQILHEKYFNPDWNIYGSQLYGLSPIKAALRRIQRNNEAQTAGAAAFRNGGVRGIVYNDDTNKLSADDDKTWEQMGVFKDTFEAESAPGSKGQGKTFFSGYKLGYQQIGIPPVDLQMLESEQVDMRFLCSIYGVPSQLLNDSAAKTYNTMVEAEKALTMRCALPLLCSRRDNLNKKFDLGNIVCDFDLSVYSELEPNKTEQVNWLAQSYLPLSRRYEIMGEDAPAHMTEEELQAIPIPSGVGLLSDLLNGGATDISAAMDALNQSGNNPYQQTT